MNPITYILNKFSTVEYNETEYVEINPLVKLYKSISGNSRAKFPDFVLDNNISYLITNKKTDKVVNQVLSKDKKFTHQSYNLYVLPEDVAKIDAFVKVLEKEAKREQALNKQPMIEQVDPEESTEIENILTRKDIQNLIDQQYPIIDLTDEEKFKDINDNIYEIETRGERSKDKILFRASHVSDFLGMHELSDVLQDNRNRYKYIRDYVILDARTIQNQASLHSRNAQDLNEVVMNLKIDSNNKKPKKIYLTLNGLLRMIFVSDSGNENRDAIRDWVVNLVYVHQFGSDIERLDLVETLKPYKKCLTELSGIYLISIGKVKDLRESMSISSELYQKKEFDNANVFKYGRSKDIMNRYAQHVARTGYGKYSDKILMEWFIVIPLKLLAAAETDLSKYFKTNQLSFEFNDGSKDHDELIIVKPGTERQHIKDKYFDIIKCYPSDTNHLIKQMTEMKLQSDANIDKLESKYKINSLEMELKLSQIESESALKLSQIECNHLKIDSDNALKIQELGYKNEILELKLKLATQ